MKQFTFLILAIAFFQISCSSDDMNNLTNESGVFKATIDGEDIQFNNSLNVHFYDVDEFSVLLITGGSNSSLSADYSTLTSEISIPDTIGLGENVYEFMNLTDCSSPNPNVCGWLSYVDDLSGNVVYSSTNDMGLGLFRIEIIELDLKSGGHIMAEFEGTLYDSDNANNSVSVTNGILDVPIM
ncbi:MAG: hypothetical protein GYB31_15465 [Bacteroidetes bacterium]|nr:hypothetical protein [Bacteroidota bacterium]